MKKMEDIRKRLYELADEHKIPELMVLAEETKRRFSGRRAPNEGIKITPQLKRDVRAFAKAYPDWSYSRLSDFFGIRNIGRISEILTGFREDK